MTSPYTKDRYNHRTTRGVLCSLLLVLVTVPASAQDAGRLAEARGRVDVEQGGVSKPLAANESVSVGDTVRTDSSGRARLLLQDETLITLGTNAELHIVALDAAAGAVPRAQLALRRGSVQILVSDRYAAAGSEYRVETPTAVTTVTGTEFVIAFDPVEDVTNLVGVSGSVKVHSVLDLMSRGVVVKASEHTVVTRGSFPTRPQPIEQTVFRQYIEDLDFVGVPSTGAASLSAPLLTADDVADPDDMNLDVPFDERVRQYEAFDQPPAALSPTGGLDFEL